MQSLQDIFRLYSDGGLMSPALLDRLLANTQARLTQAERFALIQQAGEGLDFNGFCKMMGAGRPIDSTMTKRALNLLINKASEQQTISMKQFVRLVEELGLSTRDAQLAFDKVFANGDARITDLLSFIQQ